jgi:S1-C subfamily serine protease
MTTFAEAAKLFSDAAKAGDRLAAWDAVGRVVSAIADPAAPFTPQAVRSVVWSAAKDNRWFDMAEIISGAAALRPNAAPATCRLHAQMLMERGFTDEALARLQPLLAHPDLSFDDRMQALGHTGRVFKDRFIGALARGDADMAHRHLDQALDAYRTGYTLASNEYAKTPSRNTFESVAWLGINTAALLARPETVAVQSDAGATTEMIARHLLEKGELYPDTLYFDGTAAEAHVALREYASAIKRIERYIATPTVNSFALNNLQRQLNDVWQLHAKPSPGPEMLALIRGALLQRRNGSLHMSGDDVQRARDVDAQAVFQAVFGNDRFDSYANYRLGLDQCSCVARIGKSADTGVGTGFVLPGSTLSDKLDDRFVLLTNAHVISIAEQDRETGALHPAEVVVTFAALDGVPSDQEFRIRGNLLWSSPPNQLDTVVAELDPPVTPKIKYTLAAVLPVAKTKPSVRVIGHPSGRGLSFSMNQLLDLEDPKLHYQTPTEGGSSGSPVFTHDWKLLGIHHAGGHAVPKLHGLPGRYPANEGMYIRTICERLNEALGEGDKARSTVHT